MNIKLVLYNPVTFLIFDFLLRNKVPVRLRLDNKVNLANEMKTRAYFLLAALVVVVVVVVGNVSQVIHLIKHTSLKI